MGIDVTGGCHRAIDLPTNFVSSLVHNAGIGPELMGSS